MTKAEKKQILLNSIFNIGYNLASSFLSVYLFAYAKSLITMSIYTMIRIGLLPPFFILGNKLSKKHSFALTYTIGLVFITTSLFYALLGTSLFQTNGNYVLIAAAITGIGEGFFWYSNNTCTQIVTDIEHRARYISVSGIFSNVVTICAPFLARMVLQFSESDLQGYRIILMIITGAYISVIFIATTIQLHAQSSPFPLTKAFSLKDKKWRYHQFGVFFYGLRNSLALTLISILIYNATSSGKLYANLQIAFGILGIICYRLLTRLFKKERIKQTFIIGAIINCAAILVLVFTHNMFGAVFYGSLAAVASAMYDNCYAFISSNIISTYKEGQSERVVTREVALSTGRCSGMLLIIIIYCLLNEPLYLPVAVTILSLAPFASVYFLLKVWLAE